MKKISPYLLLLAALLLSACAGEVTGHVFLDNNNNSKLDTDEKGISKALYEVDRDGQLFTSGVTDENGMFLFKKKDKGDYCVKVINTSDKYKTNLPGLTKEPVTDKAAAKAVLDETTTTDTGTDTKTDEEKKKEETKKEPVSETPLPAATSLRNCVRLTGYSDKGTVNVPVGQDVDASIIRIPTQGEIIVAAGSEFDLKINYPSRCTLNPISLPSELSFVGKDSGALASGNMLDLAALAPSKDEIKKMKKDKIIKDPKSLTEMLIVPVIVKLKASEDILEKERDIEITPTVECPDGNITPLETIKIKIKKTRGLVIEQEIPEKEWLFDGTYTLSTRVRNTGSFDYNGNSLLTIVLPDAAKIVGELDNSKCWSVPSVVECNVTSVKAGEQFKLTFKMKLPSKANYSSGYDKEIKTQLNYNEADAVNSDSVETDIETKIIPVNIAASTSEE